MQIQPAHTISLMPSCLSSPERGTFHPLPAQAISIYQQGAIPSSMLTYVVQPFCHVEVNSQSSAPVGVRGYNARKQ